MNCIRSTNDTSVRVSDRELVEGDRQHMRQYLESKRLRR